MLNCAVDKNDEMAIHWAAFRGHLDVVKYLICDAGVDVNVRGGVS